MRLRSLLVPKVLVEVVLYSPAETVLAPYIDQAPSPATKQWFATNFKNWLVKSPENLHKLPYLPRNATEKQQKAHAFSDLYDLRLTPGTETAIEHILDFFRLKPDPPRLERMSVENVIDAANNEMNQYNARIAKQAQKSGGIPDDPAGVTTVMEFPGGYRIVELTTNKALDREGSLMGHCVGQLHACYILDKSRRIFSLRDPANMPHTTIEVHTDKLNTSEIKGRENAPPVRRYWPMLRQFIEQYGVVVDHDHHNIGLLQIADLDNNVQTMTQDQFRDMVLDPANERGKKLMTHYTEHPNEYIHDTDLTIGMFTALYGSDQLNDTTIQSVFQNGANHAIQTVQHFGNRFTPQQLVIAFTSMRPEYGQKIGSLFKTLLISTKPDAAVCNQIIDAMGGSVSARRSENMDSEFIAAVSQVLPQVYQEIMADPQAVERELNTDNNRAAGPFFVFSTTDQLTANMIGKAFLHMPEEAMKRVQRDKIKLDVDRFDAIVSEISDKYWGRDETNLNTILDELISYTQPDNQMLRSAFDNIKNNEFAAKFLITAKQHVPAALDADVVEAAVLKIDKDEMYQRYLLGEPTPSLAIQQRMLQKDMTNTHNDTHLQYLRQIDSSIYGSILQTLRPGPIPTKKDDYRHVKIKPKSGVPPVVGAATTKQVKFSRPLTAEEQLQARGEQRNNARGQFLRILSPALREPGDPDDGFIKPEGAKFQAARAAFAAMGKDKLFDTAVNRINHKFLMARITPDYGRGGDRALFIEHLDTLPARDITRVIDGGRDGSHFGILVNHAPYRVPEVISIVNNDPYRSRSSDIGTMAHYGKYDFAVDKEKSFEALEAVWASTRVPEGIKDDFTLKVFKRFKPTPARLIDMLEKADSEGATLYVLKKTKKPSPPLVRWVYDGFPNLLTEIPIAFIPEDVLMAAFTEEKGRFARSLMDRDLRDYGSDDSRRRWHTDSFRGKIDRTSEVFARYQKAAQAAGTEAAFARYVRQAELEDTHSQLTNTSDDDYNENKKTKINMEMLKQNLDDYSNRSLIHVAQHDDTGAVQALYFDRFTPQKLANLIANGVFTIGSNSWDRKEVTGMTKKVNSAKLRAAVLIALQNEADIGNLLGTMVSDGFKFDDDLILAVFAAKDSGSYRNNAKDTLMQGDISDKVKNWIADHEPHNIDDIAAPTPYVIGKLFDNYGGLVRDYKKNITVDSSFARAIVKWFSDHGTWFHYKANPAVAQMLTDEAKRRGGAAVIATRAMLQHLANLKKKASTSEYVSGSSVPIIKTVPPGMKIGKDE